MPLRAFLPYDILGAGLWSALFCLLGYFFWQSLDKVEAYIGKGAAAFTRAGRGRRSLIWFAVRCTATRSSAPRCSSGSTAARVAARPRPAVFARRQRDARARAGHAAGARRGRHLPVLRPRVADRSAQHAAARPGRVRHRRRACTCRRSARSSASLTAPRLAPGHQRRRARHRDLGRPAPPRPRGRRARPRPRAHLRRRPRRQGRDGPPAADRPALRRPRGSPIPPATPPTRSPASPARSCSRAPATAGRRASRW